jgi:hypothetical protein
MKRPAFQFYPADWRSNAKLRRCSDAARGAWMDILCVLHGADEYGVVRWPLTELARSAGVSLRLARELAAKGVLKGADSNAEPYVHTPTHAGRKGEPVILVQTDGGPVWYCSRLVRDEWTRHRRGAGTRFDSENQPSREPTGTPTRREGERQGDGPSSSSSSSASIPVGDGNSTGARAPDPPASSSLDQGKEPQTKRGQIAKALTELGVTGVNPTHAELVTLIDAGAELDEFRDAAKEAIANGNCAFIYILRVIAGRRRRAAKEGPIPNGAVRSNGHLPGSSAHKPYVKENRVVDRERAHVAQAKAFADIASTIPGFLQVQHSDSTGMEGEAKNQLTAERQMEHVPAGGAS